MLDKYGQEQELTSLQLSKILTIIEEPEKTCLRCLEGGFFSIGRQFLNLKQIEGFFYLFKMEGGEGVFSEKHSTL